MYVNLDEALLKKAMGLCRWSGGQECKGPGGRASCH